MHRQWFARLVCNAHTGLFLWCSLITRFCLSPLPLLLLSALFVSALTWQHTVCAYERIKQRSTHRRVNVSRSVNIFFFSSSHFPSGTTVAAQGADDVSARKQPCNLRIGRVRVAQEKERHTYTHTHTHTHVRILCARVLAQCCWLPCEEWLIVWLLIACLTVRA